MHHAYCLDLYHLRRWTKKHWLRFIYIHRIWIHTICTSVVTLPYNFLWDGVHFSNATVQPYVFSSKQCPLVLTDMKLTMYTVGKAHTRPDTLSSRCTLFDSPEWLHSLWFNGHFVGCNSILSHPLVPTGEITGSGLIHKTQRTTLESLLQFEPSNHNGRMRLPFFPWCGVCMCGQVCTWRLAKQVYIPWARRLGLMCLYSSHLFSFFLTWEMVVFLCCFAGFALQNFHS